MSNRLSVLIAEDNPVNQRVLGLLLESLEVSFDFANDGQEAVQAVAQNDFGLILMDCMMPVVDGFQASFEIRKNEFFEEQVHANHRLYSHGQG